MNFFANHESLLFLRQKKAKIVLGGFLALTLYILVFQFYPKAHESNAVIYSSTKNKTENIQLSVANSLQEVGESYTIINWVYSTQLINHLISNFNLFVHYQINPKEPDAYSTCFNEITRNINVNLTPYGAVRISVIDRDKYLAADIANEILKQIDKLNKLKVIENRKGIIREYDFLLREFSSDVDAQREGINKLLEEFSILTKQASIPFEKKEITLNSLANASRNYENLSNDWLNLRKVHLLSLKEIEKFNLPSFVIVQHALPELDEPFFSVNNFAFMLLVFVFGIWLAVVILLIQFKYSAHLKFLFSSSYSGNGKDNEDVAYSSIKTNGKDITIEKKKISTNN